MVGAGGADGGWATDASSASGVAAEETAAETQRRFVPRRGLAAADFDRRRGANGVAMPHVVQGERAGLAGRARG